MAISVLTVLCSQAEGALNTAFDNLLDNRSAVSLQQSCQELNSHPALKSDIGRRWLEWEMEKQKKIEDRDNAETDTEWSPSDVWSQHEVLNPGLFSDWWEPRIHGNVDLNSVPPDAIHEHWLSLSLASQNEVLARHGINPLFAFLRRSRPEVLASRSYTRSVSWTSLLLRDHEDEPNPVARDHADEPNPVVDGFEVVHLPDWANR